MGYYTNSGYNTTAVDKVNLPAKIKCVRCDKVKNQASFSNKQLGDLQAKIRSGRFNPTTSKYIACIGCTGGQVVELECYACGKTQGLDRFSKAQRKTPDKAKCWKCMQVQLNTEPGAEDGDESSGSGSGDFSDNSDSSDDDAATLPGTMSGMSLNGSSNYTSFPNSSNGGVQLNGLGAGTLVSNGSYINASTTSRSSLTVVSGTENGAKVKRAATPPHQRRKASPVSSDEESVATTTASRAPSKANGSAYGDSTSRRGNAPSYTASNNKTSQWARVRPTPQKIVFDVVQQEKKIVRPIISRPTQRGQAEPEVDDDITVESSSDESD